MADKIKRITKTGLKNLATNDARSTKNFRTGDSFANFMANVGHGTGNQNDGSHYAFNPITRNRLQMEWVYRGSWIAGVAVDCVAEDMTREGIEIKSSDKPDRLTKLGKEVDRLTLWDQICQTIKWARLYGGSVAFMMIDGQKPETPLNPKTIAKGQFKGLLPMDRWMVNPSLEDLITDYGPNFGKPKFYQTVPDAMGMPLMRIHYSRVVRIDGVLLPYWQKISENLWGQSILERMWDRLIAFDSTTTGVAQLVYKAHLRTYSMKDLREIIATGGPAMQAVMTQLNMIRALQTNEGITLMDAGDKFDTHQYTFAGLDAVLQQFGQQLSGALGIPLVRLFGQSPGGLNSTGDSDLRMYYDNIKRQQVSMLGPALELLFRIVYLSTFGTEPPEHFDLSFRSLWQMDDSEKADTAYKNVQSVNTLYESKIISRATALKEVKQQSEVTGLGTNITDEEVAEAENDPAPSPEMLGLEAPESVPMLGKPNGAGNGAAKNTDAWEESKHPRDPTGKFGEGGTKKNSQWVKTSGALGSNEGGVYEFNGHKFYVKFPKNLDQGKTEVMTANILTAMGIANSRPEYQPINGKPAVVTAWKDLKKVDWSNPESVINNLGSIQRVQLAKMYYAAALTENWDTLGVDYSNIMMDSAGNLVQMDTGGSFEFRAQGKSKPYASDITPTLANLMNPTYPAGKVFSALKSKDPAAFTQALKDVKALNVIDVSDAFSESALDKSDLLHERFNARVKQLSSAPKKIVDPPKPTPAWSDPNKLKKGDPGYQTIHQRLRNAMRTAHEANGPKASEIVAATIKVPPPPLSNDNRLILNSYVGSSAELNRTLRESAGSIEGLGPVYQKKITVMDEMLKSARDYAVPIKLTRGMPNHAIPNAAVGETFVDHAYQSTTFAKAVSQSFGQGTTVLNITIPKGFKFLSVPSFAKASANAGHHFSGHATQEAEAILPRGTGYRIKKVSQEGTHRVLDVEAVFNSLQPSRDEWKSTKASKKPSLNPDDLGVQ